MSRDSVVSEWQFEVQRTVAGPAALGVGAVATFDPVLGVTLDPTMRKGTALSAIDPARFIDAVAGRKPAF